MNKITITPSVIAQGTLTFVAAITCADAIKEIVAAFKPTSHVGSAAIKLLAAIVVVLLIIMIIWLLPTDNKSANIDPTMLVMPEKFIRSP